MMTVSSVWFHQFTVLTYVPTPPSTIVWIPTVIDPWQYRPWFKSSNWRHSSFLNSATIFFVYLPPMTYAASGLCAVEYSDIWLKNVFSGCPSEVRARRTGRVVVGRSWGYLNLLWTKRIIRAFGPLHCEHIQQFPLERTISIAGITSNSECLIFIISKTICVIMPVLCWLNWIVIFAIETEKKVAFKDLLRLYEYNSRVTIFCIGIIETQ